MIQDRLKNKHNDIQGLKKQSSELLNCAWEKGYVAGFNDGYATRREADKRPQGEWIRKVDDVGFVSYICSECGAEIEVEDSSDDKFCFNCGAKMKGGAV